MTTLTNDERETRIGTIKRAYEIGHKGKHKYIWAICPTCNNTRWVELASGKARSFLCASCSRMAYGNKNWKGGRHNDSYGYVLVYLYPTNFFYPMANSKHYVFEHRLIMARHLGRCLQSWEVIHHKNGIRDDNQLENLELITRHGHIQSHNKGYKDGYIKGFNDGRSKKIQILEHEIERLKEVINEPIKLR